jgi:hypothetical protein
MKTTDELRREFYKALEVRLQIIASKEALIKKMSIRNSIFV